MFWFDLVFLLFVHFFFKIHVKDIRIHSFYEVVVISIIVIVNKVLPHVGQRKQLHYQHK